MDLEALRLDCAINLKKGIHFIITSVFIWFAICIVQLLDVSPFTKNLLTFCCTAALGPLAFMISKIIKIDFKGNGNPLNNLGVLFSVNQFLYLLIAMWIYNAVPEKMVMVLAIIFGAHLLPFSWLYQSKLYMVFAIVVSIGALIIGLSFPSYVLAGGMIGVEALFSILLWLEVRSLLGTQTKGIHTP